MEKNLLFAKITDNFLAKILSWAIKKTGNRPDSEDLAQEVLLQIFHAVSRHDKIEKPENFVWKIAHYVWCNYTRELTRSNFYALDEAISDKSDFQEGFLSEARV